MPRSKTERNSEIEIAGPRVVLRRLTDDDVAAVEPWYAEAAAAVHGLRRQDASGVQNRSTGSGQALYHQLEAPRSGAKGGLLVIARRKDSTPIGLLDYRADDPAPGWLSVGFVALAEEQRGWGYGSEAVRLLEAEARRRWRRRCIGAKVDLRNGLGLYFWLRLGYRPTVPVERPCASGGGEDVIWMIRRSRRSPRPVACYTPR